MRATGDEITGDEKTLLAPALRRACALLLHWSDSGSGSRDMEGISCILSELTTLSEAADTILALLLLHENVLPDTTMSTLHGLVQCAALHEGNPL
jgi:hypothetical protein